MKMIHVEMSDVHVLVSRAHTNCQTSIHSNPADIDGNFFKYITIILTITGNEAGSDFFMLHKCG